MLKVIILSIYSILLTGISWVINGPSVNGIDDANIYMVYMRNFANGHGFVYNVAGERVEGFTSLLWTLTGSFFYVFTDSPETVLLLLNMILSTWCLYQVVDYLDRGNKHLLSRRSLLFLGLIALTPGFIDWTVFSLMETGLWCLLLTTTALTIIRYRREDAKRAYYLRLGLLSSALLLCRPDAMLWCPIIIGLAFIKEYQFDRQLKRSALYALIPAGVALLTLGFIVWWRVGYFGYPLPNTYYAKVSSNRIDNLLAGGLYVSQAVLEKPFLLPLLVLSVYLVFKKRLQMDAMAILSLITICSFFTPLYSGGDHFGLQRFFIPTVPLMLMLLVMLLDKKGMVRSFQQLTLILSLFFFSNDSNFIDIFMHRKSPIRFEWKIAEHGRVTSKKLNAFFSDITFPSQGVLTAGGAAYTYRGETIDLMGLNNTLMAHAKQNKPKGLLKNHASFDKNTFYALSPDIFWYEGAGFYGHDQPPVNMLAISPADFIPTTFSNIHLDPLFRNHYALVDIRKPNAKQFLRIYARKGFLDSLPCEFDVAKITFE